MATVTVVDVGSAERVTKMFRPMFPSRSGVRRMIGRLAGMQLRLTPKSTVWSLRDGNIGRNIFVNLSADQTSTTVTVAIGTEQQLGLALAWSTGLANYQAQGDVAYTD